MVTFKPNLDICSSSNAINFLLWVQDLCWSVRWHFLAMKRATVSAVVCSSGRAVTGCRPACRWLSPLNRGQFLCLWPLRADSRREVSVSAGPPVWFCQLPPHRQPAAVAPPLPPEQSFLMRKPGDWDDSEENSEGADTFTSLSLKICFQETKL